MIDDLKEIKNKHQKTCQRCNRIIVPFKTHFYLEWEDLDGDISDIHFCNDCIKNTLKEEQEFLEKFKLRLRKIKLINLIEVGE